MRAATENDQSKFYFLRFTPRKIALNRIIILNLDGSFKTSFFISAWQTKWIWLEIPCVCWRLLVGLSLVQRHATKPNDISNFMGVLVGVKKFLRKFFTKKIEGLRLKFHSVSSSFRSLFLYLAFMPEFGDIERRILDIVSTCKSDIDQIKHKGYIFIHLWHVVH